MEFNIDIEGFTEYLTKDGVSPRTISDYTNFMKAYGKRFVTFSFENSQELEECCIEDNNSPATINRWISAINKYICYLQSKGATGIENWKMTNHKIHTKQYLDDVLSLPDYEYLLKRAKSQENWVVYLYARISGTTGMRLCEMLQIKREHIQHGYVDIYGKGRKQRRIYFPVTMRQDVLRVLDTVKLASGYIFSRKFDGQNVYGAGGRFIQDALRSFGIELGFARGLVHAHGFRHFFAKEFIRKHQNIALLADLLGHNRLETTRIYLKMTSKEQAEIVNEVVTW